MRQGTGCLLFLSRTTISTWAASAGATSPSSTDDTSIRRHPKLLVNTAGSCFWDVADTNLRCVRTIALMVYGNNRCATPVPAKMWCLLRGRCAPGGGYARLVLARLA